MTSKLGMSYNLKKRLLESARHRHVWASSGWTPFCFQRSELRGLGHLYCTGCMSLLTGLPCLPALNSSSSALPGCCHLLIASMGVVWFVSQTLRVQGTYAILILILWITSKQRQKKFPAAHQGSQWTFQQLNFPIFRYIRKQKERKEGKNPTNWQKQTCCQMHRKESM